MNPSPASSRPPQALKTAAFFVVVFLCVFIPVRSVLELYLTAWIKVVPDLLVLALLGWYAISVRLRFRFLPQDFLFLAFLLLGFVSSMLVNHSGIMPYVFHLRSIAVYYALYFVVRNLDFGKKELTTMVTVLQGMCVLLFVFAFIEIVTSKTVLFPQSVADGIIYATNFARAYSLLFNPNSYALLLDFVIFLSLTRRIVYGIKTSVAIYGVLAVSILLSMSRSGLIFLAAGLILFGGCLLRKQPKRIPYKKVITCVLVTAVIGCGGYLITKSCATLYYNAVLAVPDSGESLIGSAIDVDANDRFNEALTGTEWEKSAVDGRVYSIKKGLEIWTDHPVFGTGFGTYGSGASLNFKPAIADQYELPYPFYADNQYINILVENGALGTLVFGAFLISILICYRKEPFKLFFCLLFGWFGLFFNIFEVQIGTVLFWTFLALPPFPSLPSDADGTL